MNWPVNPLRGKTTDWRAVCGKSACTVRRGEGPNSIGPSYPYLPCRGNIIEERPGRTPLEDDESKRHRPPVHAAPASPADIGRSLWFLVSLLPACTGECSRSPTVSCWSRSSRPSGPGPADDPSNRTALDSLQDIPSMYIVTGAAGFVGSNLIRALNEREVRNILAVDDLTQGDKFRNLRD